jgi:hypothetical protein
MEQLPGTEAEILKNARSWGASWAAGISLTGQEKKVLRKTWSIQHTRESHDSEDSGPNDDWAREELRSALENLEEKDFRALMSALEMEKRIEDRIRRVMEEKGQTSEQARGARVDGVQEVLREQWEVMSSRLPEEQLSRPQKEALRSLDLLREEVKKTPYD